VAQAELLPLKTDETHRYRINIIYHSPLGELAKYKNTNELVSYEAQIDCKALSPEKGQQKQVCSIVPGSALYESRKTMESDLVSASLDTNGAVTILWGDQGKLLSIESAMLKGVMGIEDAFSVMELPGRPTSCSPKGRWKWKELVALGRYKTTAPGSAQRFKYSIEHCDDQVATIVSDARLSMMAGFSGGSSGSTRITIDGEGKTIINLETGWIISRFYRQEIVSSASDGLSMYAGMAYELEEIKTEKK